MSEIEIRQPYRDAILPELLARKPAPRRALFLDRDGVINVNHGYVHSPEQTEWMPGIFDLVSKASAKGFLPVVVTNQAGIGRGYYDEHQFLHYTDWIHAQFKENDAPLVATYFCPHHPDAVIPGYRAACGCRKPAPGMLNSAIEFLQLDRSGSVLVGDNRSDIEAGISAGVGQLFLLGSHSPFAEAQVVPTLSDVVKGMRMSDQ